MRPLYLLLLFFLPVTLLAQEIEWSKNYGGKRGDRVHAMVRSNSNKGYVLAGLTGDSSVRSFPHENSKGWILCIGNEGDVKWERTFGGPSTDVLNDIQRTDDGGYITVGYSKTSDKQLPEKGPDFDVWVLKLDPSGELEWQKTYGGAKKDEGLSVVQMQDNCYVIAGTTHSDSHKELSSEEDSNDIWILNLGSNGEVNWEKTINKGFNDYEATIKNNEKGVTVALKSITDSAVWNWLIGLNKDGETMWEKRLDLYGANALNNIETFLTNERKEMVLTGMVVPEDSEGLEHLRDSSGKEVEYPDQEVWVRKLNGRRETEWTRFFVKMDSYDKPHSIRKTTDGGFIVVGGSGISEGHWSFEDRGPDYYMIKLDSKGEKEWSATYGGKGSEEAFDVHQAQDGGYIVAGYSESSDRDVPDNNGGNDAWVIKVRPPERGE